VGLARVWAAARAEASTTSLFLAVRLHSTVQVVTKVPAYAPGWALLGKVYEDSSDRNKVRQALGGVAQ